MAYQSLIDGLIAVVARALLRVPVIVSVRGPIEYRLGESLQRKQVLRYPSASLQVVDGAGHDVAWVKTAAVLTHIRSDLDARVGGAR